MMRPRSVMLVCIGILVLCNAVNGQDLSETHDVQRFSPSAYALAAKHGHSVFVEKVGKKNDEGQIPTAMAVQQLMLYSVRNARRAISSVTAAADSKAVDAELGRMEDSIINSIDEIEQYTDLSAPVDRDDTVDAAKKASGEPQIISTFRDYLDAKLTKQLLAAALKERNTPNETSVAPAEGYGVGFVADSLAPVAKSTPEAFKLLNNGMKIPAVGFGTWQMEGEAVYDAVITALASGVRHIDTAQSYGNEQDVGRALKDSKVPRGDVFLATKLSEEEDFGKGKARKRAMSQMKELGVDYLDLYMIHGLTENDEKNKETWQELEQLVDEKKVRSIGVSNYEVKDLKKLVSYAKIRPVTVQNKMDPYLFGSHEMDGTNVSQSVLKYCHEQNIQFVAYSILQGWPHELHAREDPHVATVANAHGKTPSQVLLRWALQMGAAIIPKSADAERIVENTALFDFELSHEEMTLINGLSHMVHMSPPDYIHNMHDIGSGGGRKDDL